MTNPAQAAKLSPCPFCGSQPAGPIKSGGGDERNGYNFTLRIVCRCGATMKAESHHGMGGWCDDTGQADAAVRQAWNKRA